MDNDFNDEYDDDSIGSDTDSGDGDDGGTILINENRGRRRKARARRVKRHGRSRKITANPTRRTKRHAAKKIRRVRRHRSGGSVSVSVNPKSDIADKIKDFGIITAGVLLGEVLEAYINADKMIEKHVYGDEAVKDESYLKNTDEALAAKEKQFKQFGPGVVKFGGSIGAIALLGKLPYGWRRAAGLAALGLGISGSSDIIYALFGDDGKFAGTIPYLAPAADAKKDKQQGSYEDFGMLGAYADFGVYENSDITEYEDATFGFYLDRINNPAGLAGIF